jgi:uncharacterized protein YabE (DUF348 family)
MHKKFNLYKRRFTLAKRRHLRTAKRASRHPFAVPIFVFIGLLIITVLGFLVLKSSPSAAKVPIPKVVIISHDHIQQVVPSIEPTVGKLLSKLNISLHPGDVVEPSLNTPINQDDFRINIYRAVPVEIVDNSQDIFTFSAAATPRAIAEQAGIKINPADYVSTIPTSNFLSQRAIGEQVVIDPATPVNLNVYGIPLVTYTHATTVADLIKLDNIHLAPNDQIIPALDTPITPDMQVAIVRNGIKVTAVTQTIPMPIDTVYDSSLSYGTNAIQQQGSAGQEVITYQENTQNGVMVSSTPIQTVITVPPVTEIILEGTNLSGIKGDMALAGIPPGDYQYADYIISNESGWCPTKWQGDIGYCPATFVQQYANDAYVGYGLCQSTPPDKMAAFGSDWQTNPITQLEWCNWYADTRYGGWYEAYVYWTANHNW